MKRSPSRNRKTKEKRRFQTESKELLDILINSLYTHRDIFLREIISNASDALDKLSFLSLTNSRLLENDTELKILIEIDREEKTLTIVDNGIGMTYKEVIDNIGTIAKSGSKLFIEQFKKNKNLDLIGKFGVGFYSSFMVAKKVTLLTRAAREKKGFKWESIGDGTYTIEEVNQEDRGTRIILHLRDDVLNEKNPKEDFSNQYTIKSIVEKYSSYIRYPIKMNFPREEYQRDKDGKIIEGTEPTIVVETKTLNEMIPLWGKNKTDISGEEYGQFYKHYFHDWNGYADVIHVKAEGTIQYSALIYIPLKVSSDLYDRENAKGVDLFSNKVLIMKNCQDLLPEHLRFVRGIVDSADFSLNISREMLQHDRQLRILRKHLVKKVLDSLMHLLKDHRKKYEEMWQDIGKAIKGGIYMRYENKEPLQDLLLFHSSKSTEVMTTLKEYTERMPVGQNEIYYAAGKNVEFIERMPHLEIFRDKNIEILYFIDKIDEFLLQNIDEYNQKKLKSICRSDINLGSFSKNRKQNITSEVDNKKRDPNEKDQEEDKYKDLLTCIKSHLKDKVKEVRISKRLTTSPVCIVSTSNGPSVNMEILLREANQLTSKAGKILELNMKHRVFSVLHKIFNADKNSENMKNCCELLYNQALLIEGYELDDPVDFSKCLSDLMVNAYQCNQQ